MGISMQCDKYKNKGYGTQAEILALRYAFFELGMKIVYADALIGNQRIQHVLEKVGFTRTHEDERFVYYACRKSQWNAENAK